MGARRWIDPAQGENFEALVGNARSMLGIADFATWLWSFAAAADEKKPSAVPSQTAQSVLMSKGLKKAGFRFVGPTICYAFMQSAGMVNDHHPIVGVMRFVNLLCNRH